MEIALEKGEMLSIEGDGRGVSVRCRRGALWLTQEGDGHDHILDAGEEFRIRCRGTVVVAAGSDAAVGFDGVRMAPSGGRGWSLRLPALMPPGRRALSGL